MSTKDDPIEILYREYLRVNNLKEKPDDNQPTSLSGK